MFNANPGTYVLYDNPSSDRHPWPAVVIPDNFAPQHVRRRRKIGYVTLVLLIKSPYSFKWAYSNQIAPFTHFTHAQRTPEELRNLPNGLQEAYAIAESVIESGGGLGHWREEIHRQHGKRETDEFDDAIIDLVDERTEEDINKETEIALAVSWDLAYGSKNAAADPVAIPANTQSPRERESSPPDVIMIDDSDDDSTDFDSGLVRPERIKSIPFRPQTQKRGPPATPRHDDTSKTPSKKKKKKKKKSTPQQNIKPKNPQSKPAEQEVQAKDELVRIHIGNPPSIIEMPRHYLWQRRYFRDPMRGLHYFEFLQQGLWQLTHPQLPNITAEDFGFIMEYWTSGDFGIRAPSSEHEAHTAFIQCGTAWHTAERLAMHDLLDFIAEKLARIEPWDPIHALSLAARVYGSQDAEYPAYEAMKALLAEYIQRHYWEYVDSDGLRAQLKEKMMALPELERDVNAMRVAELDAEMQDEDDSDDDGEGEGEGENGEEGEEGVD